MTKGIKLYSKSGLSAIKNTSMLSNDDINKMEKLSTELERVYHVKQVFRTPTEMRYSVLNDTDCPTPASKYWQSIREQDNMFSALISLSFGYDEKLIDLELCQLELDEMPKYSKRDMLLIRKKEIEMKQLKFDILSYEQQAKNRVREIEMWEKIKDEQKEKEDFDINDVDKHQFESYRIRWARESKLGQHNSYKNLSTIEGKEIGEV